MDERHPWTSTGYLKASPGLPYILWHQAGRYHYDEQGHGGEMREKEEQKDLCAVERGETKEPMVVRNGLMGVDFLLPQGQDNVWSWAIT